MDLTQKSILSSSVDNFRAEIIQLRIFFEGLVFSYSQEIGYYLSMSSLVLVSISQLFLRIDILISRKECKQMQNIKSGITIHLFSGKFLPDLFLEGIE